MSLETRARAAAEGLRTATDVDVDTGLARLRRTHRHRNTTRLAGAALAVACVVGGGVLMVGGTDRTAPPVDRKPDDDGLDAVPSGGLVVDAIEVDWPRGPVSEVGLLPDAGGAPYPPWQAFDQEAGQFLYTAEGGPDLDHEEYRTILVLAPGADSPVATIDCVVQCNFAPTSFGPGPDEVTALSLQQRGHPDMAHVMGFDSEVHQRIDLSAVAYGGESELARGISDIEWSPDGSQLAVATFEGAYEPGCEDVANDARVYLFDRAGGEPVLVHRQEAEPGTRREPPTIHQLAWSPDGTKLGMVTSTYCTREAPPPTLVAVDVESGQAETLHTFFDSRAHDPYSLPVVHGFAWSPDGTRIAVTSGADITELSSDGRRLGPMGDSGAAPLAWLAPTPD